MLGSVGLVALSILALTATAAPLDTRTLQTHNNDCLLSISTYKSPHTISLRKCSIKGPNTRSAGYQFKDRHNTANVTSLLSGQEYATSITFGNQTFEVILDTGSSDTWVPQSAFKCYDLETHNRTLQASCGFGPELYIPSSTFKKFPGELFDIGYGDGEFGYGYMGNESAAWEGDNITPGLVGLAYSAETTAYHITISKQHRYDSIFTNMYKHDLVDPYFSLAISRNVYGDSGYFTLGGLPPIKFNHTWTITDILVADIKGYPKTWDFYTIYIDDVTANDKNHTKAGDKRRQYIVDSAKKNADGTYRVACNATPPTHGVTINGNTFTINPLDMILPYGQDYDDKEICFTDITDGGDDVHEDIFILGDTFLKNVVAVFDVGAVKMRFAPNVEYNSNP
ncbi:acid protease [Penicillium malachiteum]|uniref:acid protease n=1 Tax=Penicillium malachiteum TaxID=1324776 RepID=UPI00254743EB|nr:acid protease [Penicillium malachiteum]KAJ5721159.1 acid protease [Penicillium malachiteum]